MVSRALTKIQSVALIAIVVIAAVGGSTAYVLWSASQPPLEGIVIGVCGDLDMPNGKATWQGAILAAEQINAQGGILGRNVTIVAEDDDSESGRDVITSINAMTKLITVDKVDYVIFSAQGVELHHPLQDVCVEHKKLVFSVATPSDNMTLRVLDNYDRYKYYFRLNPSNTTSSSNGVYNDILTLGKYTGFTKIALLMGDSSTGRQMSQTLHDSLPKAGFEIVYNSLFPPYSTIDFSSYLAAIVRSGAEILIPLAAQPQAGTSLVKEWCDRQSPFIVWGIISMADRSDFWELTEGKCEFVSFAGSPVVSGYPITSKTASTRNAYLQRWVEVPTSIAAAAYDGIRFILPDAIKRAGTTETEAVVKSLETTDVETSMARHFVFTSTHDVMIGPIINKPGETYMVTCMFQWQNETQVPVCPEELMLEAGATYKYPPWKGPWINQPTP